MARDAGYSWRAWDELPLRFLLTAIVTVGVMELMAAPFFTDRDPNLPLLGLRFLESIALLVLILRMGLAHAVGLIRPDRRALGVFAVVALASVAGFGAILAVAYAFGIALLPGLGAPVWLHGWEGMLLMLILAPLAEELFFRGVIYRLFRQSFGIPLALLLSASGFAMMHGQWLSPQLIGGLIFAWAYEKSRNIWVPAALHAGANAAVLLLDGWKFLQAPG